jgi:hypothetical protein
MRIDFHKHAPGAGADALRVKAMALPGDLDFAVSAKAQQVG